jgi:hypothetical protein
VAALANICERGYSTSKLRPIRKATKPHDSKRLTVGTFQQVDHIRNAAIVHNSSDLGRSNRRRRVWRTIVVETSVSVEHPGRQAKMASSGLTGYNQFRDIKPVLLRVSISPPQRAAAVFDRRRRERLGAQSVFNIDGIHSTRKVRQEEEYMIVLYSLNAIVDHRDTGSRFLPIDHGQAAHRKDGQGNSS